MSEDFDGADQEQEFEEIDSQEVERVTLAIGELMETVESHNVYELLQQAYDGISDLTEWEEEVPEDRLAA